MSMKESKIKKRGRQRDIGQVVHREHRETHIMNEKKVERKHNKEKKRVKKRIIYTETATQ